MPSSKRERRLHTSPFGDRDRAIQRVQRRRRDRDEFRVAEDEAVSERLFEITQGGVRDVRSTPGGDRSRS